MHCLRCLLELELTLIHLYFSMKFVGSGWIKIKPEYVDSLSDEVLCSYLVVSIPQIKST